jgi:hypothetical protein
VIPRTQKEDQQDQCAKDGQSDRDTDHQVGPRNLWQPFCNFAHPEADSSTGAPDFFCGAWKHTMVRGAFLLPVFYSFAQKLDKRERAQAQTVAGSFSNKSNGTMLY